MKRIKHLTVSIAFFLLSLFTIKGAAGVVLHTNHTISAHTNPDDAEKAPEEKNHLAEEYVNAAEAAFINDPINFDTAKHNAAGNINIPQPVYLSIPEPPPNGCFA